MRRIGWIPVKGYELATSIWTGKEAEEEQARAWGTEFSGVALHVPSGRPISRATTNTNPAEGSRQ